MTNFPTSLDSLTNPTSSNNLDTAGVVHATQHADANDAIEALEAKVGIDGSAVATTLDYKTTFDGTAPATLLLGEATSTTGNSAKPARRNHTHGIAFAGSTDGVTTSESTTSTAFTNLATLGPEISVQIGSSGIALVIVDGKLSNTSNTAIMGFALSGANSAAATDVDSAQCPSTVSIMQSRHTLVTNLSPGVTTFTAKYRVTGGTGTFANRRIIVIPI